LLRRCQVNGLPHIAMSGFADANLDFSRWLHRVNIGVAPEHVAVRQPEMLAASI